jgi:hypothetical protein
MLPQTSSHNAYTYSCSFCGSLLSILFASSPIVTFLPTSTIDQTPLPPLLPPSSPFQKNARNHRNNAQKETRVSTSKAESADATRQPTEGTTSYTHFFFFFSSFVLVAANPVEGFLFFGDYLSFWVAIKDDSHRSSLRKGKV